MKFRPVFVALVIGGLLALSIPVVADHVAGTVPATIPHPALTAAQDNGFYIQVFKQTTGERYWRAPYLFSTPYQPNSGWLAGDRTGYGCAYAFLHHDGVLVGRVTFERLPGASYAYIIDKFMPEGQRFWDGSPTPVPGEGQGYRDCPPVDQSYDTVANPDERPKIVYWSAASVVALPKALEIRDYADTEVLAGVTFDLIEVIDEPFTVTAPTTGPQTVNSRVTVLAREAGVPFAVVYYDGIGTGQVTEENLGG